MRIEYIGSDGSTCLATGEAANGSASFKAFRAQALDLIEVCGTFTGVDGAADLGRRTAALVVT
jgi:hypothetical protein